MSYLIYEQLVNGRSCKMYLDTNEIEGSRNLSREEDYQMGFEEGYEVGYQLGFEKGYQLGIEIGQRQSATEIAEKMKAAGMDPDVIAEITGIKDY